MSNQSELEAAWDGYWDMLGPLDRQPVRNYRFVAEEIVGLGPGIRKRIKDTGLKDWDIDRAFVQEKVGIEMQGGLWMQTKTGRGKGHAHPTKIINDYRKLNAAQSIGWVVYQFDAQTLANDPDGCVSLVRDTIEARSADHRYFVGGRWEDEAPEM